MATLASLPHLVVAPVSLLLLVVAPVSLLLPTADPDALSNVMYL